MTIREISAVWGLDPVEILETAGWPADVSLDSTLKTLSGELDKGVTEIREAVKKLSK